MTLIILHNQRLNVYVVCDTACVYSRIVQPAPPTKIHQCHVLSVFGAITNHNPEQVPTSQRMSYCILSEFVCESTTLCWRLLLGLHLLKSSRTFSAFSIRVCGVCVNSWLIFHYYIISYILSHFFKVLNYSIIHIDGTIKLLYLPITTFNALCFVCYNWLGRLPVLS